MRIAVLSDIHGNAAALKAVIKALKRENIDQTIFLGDYFGEFTKPNEVFDMIKNHKNSIYVSGNKERYFEQDHFSNDEKWTFDHFQMLYWNHKEINAEHHNFIKTLPVEIKKRFLDKEVVLTHDGFDFFASIVLKAFTSSNYAFLKPKSQKEYLNYVFTTLKRSPSFLKELKKMDSDIILFGHSHIQWHCFINDKLILNPGSVGLPLNNRPGAAYSIIDINNGKVKVSERLISYSIKQTIEALKNNPLYDLSKFWSEMGIEQLRTGKDTISFFFKHVSKIKKEFPGKNHWPLDNEVFHHAIKTWPDVKASILPK